MEIKQKKRLQWLTEMGCIERDVMTDEIGDEFVMVDFENGTAADDDYEIGLSKVYLPENLQSEYVNF